MRNKRGKPLAPRVKLYGPRRLPYLAWIMDMRARGIWAPDWLREPGDPSVLSAIWTSRRMGRGWQDIDVERMGPLPTCWWLELLRRKTLVLVCRCRAELCHRSRLALLLVELGRRAQLPAIYCGETH